MKTEQTILQKQRLNSIEAIADRYSKLRPHEFVEHKFGGAKYWDMEAILAAMRELYNSTVQDTLKAVSSQHPYMLVYTEGKGKGFKVNIDAINEIGKGLML